MKARDLFGLAIRLIGFGLCLYGVSCIAEYIAIQIGYFTPQRTDPMDYFMLGAGYVLIGLYLLRGAPHFLRYAYPDTDRDPENDVSEPQNEAPPTSDN